MRLAGQVKGGFYAAAPQAVSHVMQYVSAENPKKTTILDPCCGEGSAINQIAATLDVPQRSTYAIELDGDRYAAARELMPDARVLGCSFFEVNITPGSIGFAWVNPPFDTEMGGGDRVERRFLDSIFWAMAPGGILALICPESVAEQQDMKRSMLLGYENIRIVEFPQSHRPFKEVAIMGVRRPERLTYLYAEHWDSWPEPGRKSHRSHKYVIPPTNRPAMFDRYWLTEEQIADMLNNSPLRRHLEIVAERPIPRPPMSIGKGHLALLLTAGHLDGVVHPPNEPPHVVRGTARKVQVLKGVEERVEESGETTTVTTYTERIQLVVRVMGTTGEIKTFTDVSEEDIANVDNKKNCHPRRARACRRVATDRSASAVNGPICRCTAMRSRPSRYSVTSTR